MQFTRFFTVLGIWTPTGCQAPWWPSQSKKKKMGDEAADFKLVSKSTMCMKKVPTFRL